MPVAATTGASNVIQTPDGWRLVRLGEVSAIRRKQVKPHEGDSRPFIGLENMNSRGALNGHGTADGSISNKTVFCERDTLYGKLRPNLRKVVRADFDGVCSTDILAIYANERLTYSFLNHLVRSDLLHNHAMRGVTGTRMPRTSWTHLRNYRCLLPPLSEQRAIAAVLDSIDEAIERADEVIAATERLRDALLHELLTRGLPGQHSEWKEVPGLGTIPASWRAVSMGDVAEVIGGSTPSRTQPKFWGGDIPWVVPSEVTELTARELRSSRESITDEGLRAAGLRVLPARSVLLTTRATIGATAIAALPVTTNQGFQSLVGKNGIDSLWLYYCVSSKSRELMRRGAGSTFREVSRDAVRSLPVLLPPLREQRAIAAVLDSVDACIERAREERVVLSATARSVSDVLLTGRVRVDQREEKGMDRLGRDEVLETLRTQKTDLSERFGVVSLALFGSFARDEASATSDLDLLVRFDGPTTSRAYFGVQFYIEDLLGRRVDLVTDKALRTEIRPYVEREAIDV